MGVAASDAADGRLNLFVTNSRHEPSAVYHQLAGSSAFGNARSSIDPALGSAFAGWGASWVDLTNSGSPALVLAAGAIPVTSLANDAEPVRVLGPVGAQRTLERYGNAAGALGAGLRLNGRGLAAADAGNDGRMDVAINTIGGKLVLLAPTGKSGHWLDVKLATFSPGAVVTAVLPSGRRLVRQVTAGTSYLSSEDPRVHFGLGAATRVSSLVVRYPWGGESRLSSVRADRIVEIAAPRRAPARAPVSHAPVVAGCSRTGVHGQSVARLWDEAAVVALRAGAAATPVQARDLFDLSAAMNEAWAKAQPTQSARETAISYAAYRLLLWRASFGSNLSRTFARPDDAVARALLLAGLHEHGGQLAGRAREPHRGGCDRRRRARRIARGAALRRRGLRADERAARRRPGGLDRSRSDLLAAARARADRGARSRRDPGEDPELRRLAVGPRARLRAPCVVEGAADRSRPAAVRRSVECDVQERRGCGDSRDEPQGDSCYRLISARRGTPARTRCRVDRCSTTSICISRSTAR